MKMLVITPGFLPAVGGAEIGVHEIYTRLGTRHQVTILTKSPRRPSPTTVQYGGNLRLSVCIITNWSNALGLRI
jgi:hypothetical protein